VLSKAGEVAKCSDADSFLNVFSSNLRIKIYEVQVVIYLCKICYVLGRLYW
jgi:hypothetical protein